ncbi:MAG: class I SAM-dependent methyltransferase [Polyangiaceae bacterium]|nr:class I SAM-dependent methyltransferase [Polyangiaceae bacterium]
MKPLIDPDIERYAHDHTRARPPLFDELREVTYAGVRNPGMQVGRVEGAFLKLLASLVGARRALEIGTFTGYSALCIAEALPEDGELITCDRDPEVTRIARTFFDRSGHGKKIRIALGDALESVRALPEEAAFDLVFIDADKARYPDYYDAVLPRVRTGGVIVADNTLWGGGVLDPQTDDARGIAAFNAKITADPRVENVLLTVRDGVMLARKRVGRADSQ